jgi:hypothetical protein
MVVTNEVLTAHRNNPAALAVNLTGEDIDYLVALLSEKDDELRYPAFLVLQERSKSFPDVYTYWDEFVSKLEDENSFQRNIGAVLIGYNVRWDEKKLFSGVYHRFMLQCVDEKPITARLTIQTIPNWAQYAQEYLAETVFILTGIDIKSFRETMQKLILIDIMNALIAIREVQQSDTINDYLMKAMTGGVLDKKSIKQFEKII